MKTIIGYRCKRCGEFHVKEHPKFNDSFRCKRCKGYTYTKQSFEISTPEPTISETRKKKIREIFD